MRPGRLLQRQQLGHMESEELAPSVNCQEAGKLVVCWKPAALEHFQGILCSLRTLCGAVPGHPGGPGSILFGALWSLEKAGGVQTPICCNINDRLPNGPPVRSGPHDQQHARSARKSRRINGQCPLSSTTTTIGTAWPASSQSTKALCGAALGNRWYRSMHNRSPAERRCERRPTGQTMSAWQQLE